MVVPRDPAPAGQATRLIPALEATATGAVGGVLAGAAWSIVGLGWPAAIVGAANGVISGARGIYAWRTRAGVLAFILDSTWGLPMTCGALVCHGVAAVQGRRSGYVRPLSVRANRHVYAAGFRVRRGFAVTLGNVVNGAGDASSPRRARLITDHENVHIWQSRWFGPLFPVLYVAWTVAGGAVGALVWLIRFRNARFTAVVETCGYYLNPFEWWAYSRDDNWPPARKVAGLGWALPAVPPFRRRAQPESPAAPR